MFLSFISNAVMLLVIGLIGDRTGLRTAYYLGVLAAFLTIPLLLLLPEENPNPS
jgi:MFS family permease